MALIVPSWIGNSYCFPVRLSVMVIVSWLMFRSLPQKTLNHKDTKTPVRTSSKLDLFGALSVFVVKCLFVFPRCFDLRIGAFARIFRFAVVQTEILQRLP